MQPNDRSSFVMPHRNERGIYTVFVLIVLTTLFAVIAVGADSGKLYVESLRQQRAADAAVISGASMIGSDPLNTGTPLADAKIQEIALKVAQDNFEQNYIHYDNVNPTSHINIAMWRDGDNNVNIKADTNAISDTIFTGRIVQQGRDSWGVSGTATAVRRPIEVTLAIDHTGSMGNRADVGCVGSVPIPCRSKLDAAKTAALAFLSRFNKNLDGFTMIAFDNTVLRFDRASTPADRKIPLAIGFDPVKVTNAVNSLTLGGNTAIHQGLHTAVQIALQPANPKALHVVVLITDGSPNTVGTSDDATYTPSLKAGCTLLGTSAEVLRKKVQMYAVTEADFARANGILLYTIGVGADDVTPGNPWGTVDGSGDSLLKNYLMRRLANDGAAGSSDPEFPHECANSYADNADKRQGEGLSSPNGNDLTMMLNRIAKSIQMLLIE